MDRPSDNILNREITVKILVDELPKPAWVFLLVPNLSIGNALVCESPIREPWAPESDYLTEERNVIFLSVAFQSQFAPQGFPDEREIDVKLVKRKPLGALVFEDLKKMKAINPSSPMHDDLSTPQRANRR